MKKFIFSILIIFNCATIAFAATKNSFEAVQKQLSQTTHLTGHFKQVRYIALLSSPLNSEGIFVFSKANGLTWQQEKPFKSTLQITKSKLTQRIENSPTTTLTKQEQPVVFLFTKIFLSAFRGNVSALTPYFKINFSGTARNWTITFTAKTAPINKAIQSIVLFGHQHVRKAIVKETSGDRMDIFFSHIKSS